MTTDVSTRTLAERGSSAEAATQRYLERIRAQDEKYGAFIYVDDDRALATARALDALRAAGTVLSPLHGVAVALKDHLAVEGMPTRAGSEVPIQDLVPPEGPFV